MPSKQEQWEAARFGPAVTICIAIVAGFVSGILVAAAVDLLL